MKVFYWLLILCMGVGGVTYWSGLRARPTAPTPLAAPPARRGSPLGGGMVVSSHSYPLLPVTHAPVRYIYVIDGQHVHKGDVLAKFEDHTYVVARAAGIITQLAAADPKVLVTDAFPRLWLTETTPFRLRLPLTAASVSLCPGQQLWVTNRDHPTQFVTGAVGTVLVDKVFIIIDLRLQTVGPMPLPAGT